MARVYVRALATASLLTLAAACGPEYRVPGPAADPAPAPVPHPAELPPGDPDPDAEPQIVLSPGSGTAETEVRITGRGFHPGELVELGFGPVDSEYEILAGTTANMEGRIETVVAVPDWASPGDYRFAAVREDGDPALSERFRVN